MVLTSERSCHGCSRYSQRLTLPRDHWLVQVFTASYHGSWQAGRLHDIQGSTMLSLVITTLAAALRVSIRILGLLGRFEYG